MLLAVDEIMDMGRTTINVIGNGLASVVIARWEGQLGPELADDEAAATDGQGRRALNAEAGVAGRKQR